MLLLLLLLPSSHLLQVQLWLQQRHYETQRKVLRVSQPPCSPSLVLLLLLLLLLLLAFQLLLFVLQLLLLLLLAKLQQHSWTGS